LEVAEVQRSGKKIKITSLSRVVLEKGIVVNGRIKQAGPLFSAIKETLAKAKPSPIRAKKIALGLPASQLYTAIVSLPTDGLANVDRALRAEAKRLLPIEESDLVLLSDKISVSTKDQVEYLLIGASRQVIKEWQDLTIKLKAEITSIDLEIYGLFRDLILADSQLPVCVVDLGAATSNIMIFDRGLIQYTGSVQIAGDQLTEAVASHFQLDFNLAEVKKIRLGLNRQLFPVLEPILGDMVNEIKRVSNFYQEKYGRSLNEIILVGGTCRLKGLVYYFRDQLKLPVNLGQSATIPGDYPEFIGAIGFALRALYAKERWKEEPIFDLKNLNNKQWLEGVEVTPKKDVKKIKLEDTVPDSFGPVISTNDMPNDYDARMAFEKKLLLGIILAGIPIVGAAFWYRGQQRELRKKELAGQYSSAEIQTQNINYLVTIAVKGADKGEISGREVSDKIETATSLTEAKNQSLTKVSAGLAKGESLWPEPLNDLGDPATAKAPYNFTWLAYSDKETANNVLAYARSLNTKDPNIPSQNNFTGLTKDKLIKAATPDKYQLSGVLTVSITEPIILALPVVTSTTSTVSSTLEIADDQSATSTVSVVTSSASAAPLAVGATATVQKTETGYLRVRQGPGITYAEVTKIKPGEQYKIVELKGEWAKIDISGSGSGWVKASYLQ
jgi:type IV pilus assembly protein PilM